VERKLLTSEKVPEDEIVHLFLQYDLPVQASEIPLEKFQAKLSQYFRLVMHPLVVPYGC
jgi:hypothetical protein